MVVFADGRFDYDPDRANWLAKDPLTRLEGCSAADISTQRIYMDVSFTSSVVTAKRRATLSASAICSIR